MRKRNVVLAVASLILLAGISTVVHMSTRPTPTPVRYALPYAKALKLPVTSACMTEDKALTISSSARSSVEQFALTHLYDVPAGTNVDIKLASYSPDAVTGSARYPAKYGSYNFTLHKLKNGDWEFAAYDHCR